MAKTIKKARQRMKRSKQRMKRSKLNLVYLSIIDSIEKHGRIPELGMSKQAMNRHVSHLKKEGLIEKVGYGTWQKKEVNYRDGGTTIREAYAKKVRGHGFQWLLKVKPSNWEHRESLLQAAGIHWQPLKNGFSTGQKFTHADFKVWFFKSSIRVYTPKGKDYLKATAFEGRIAAFQDLLSLIKSLEIQLRTSFRLNGNYKVKLTNQHYGLVDDLLARQRIDEHAPLRVVAWDGGWLIVDVSTGVPELECIHPVTAQRDMDEHLHPWLNDIRDNNPPLPSEMWKVLVAEVNNWTQYGENMSSHVKAVQDLSKGVNQLTEVVEKIAKKVNDSGL